MFLGILLGMGITKFSGHFDLADLHASVEKVAPGWVDQTSDPTEQIVLCKIIQSSMVTSHCLCISSDLTWIAHVHGHMLSTTNDVNSPVSSISQIWSENH